jgi:hypothetical protein
MKESWTKRLLGSKALRWVVGIAAAFALVLFCVSFFLDETIRRNMEEKINQDLKGYSVRLPKLHFQFIGMSLTLYGLTVLQEAHPDPPVAYFPVLKASIHWREIFSGRIVAKLMLEQPTININLQQLRNEAASTVPIKERGWQQALEDIYPFKINNLAIKDAKITYIDQNPKRPLVLSHLNVHATNIRNIQLPDQAYPSTFHLETAIFESGHGSIDGAANFLAQPYLGVKARFKLEKTPIDYFKPVIARSNLFIKGGILHASGAVEYAPKMKIAHLNNLTVQGMKIDYVHSPQTAKAEKQRAALVEKAASKVSNKPGLLLRADRINLTGCTLGMVNESASKPYRVFLDDTDFQLSNFSNHFSQGPAEARLKAKFMGSGMTTAAATFRPEKGGPDFDMNLKIEDTQLTKMNDLLRAYGNFDVSAGAFSLVTELHIKNDGIDGYIKPFFKNMKVYDRRKDKGKDTLQKVYEILVGGVANLLENQPREEVATKADLSGTLQNPETSTWQIILELIRNAFFKAILPSFEKEAAGAAN